MLVGGVYTELTASAELVTKCPRRLVKPIGSDVNVILAGRVILSVPLCSNSSSFWKSGLLIPPIW